MSSRTLEQVIFSFSAKFITLLGVINLGGSDLIVIGVSKTGFNNGKRLDGRHCKHKKNNRVLYFLDDEGHFHSKRVTFIQGLWYLLFKKKLKTYVCTNCDSKFRATSSGLSCPQCL